MLYCVEMFTQKRLKPSYKRCNIICFCTDL